MKRDWVEVAMSIHGEWEYQTSTSYDLDRLSEEYRKAFSTSAAEARAEAEE